MKVAATRPDTYPSRRNSLGELLEGKPHEQFLWGGAGNGLSFDSGTPRQSLTRQRTNAWLGNFRRLVVRYDRSLMIYGAFFHIACLMIVLRRVVQ